MPEETLDDIWNRMSSGTVEEEPQEEYVEPEPIEGETLSGIAARHGLTTRPPGVGLAPRPKREELPERGVAADIGAAALGGALVDLPTMGLRALRTAGKLVDPEGGRDFIRDYTADLAAGGLERLEEFGEKEIFKPSAESEESYIRRSISGGIRAIPVSLGAGLAGAAAGAVAGAPFAGVGAVPGAVIGGVLGFAGSAGTIFGLAEYDSFIEEAKDAGLEIKGKVHKNAVKSALWEGGLEAAADMIELLTLKAGRIVTKPAKETLKKLLSTSGKELVTRLGVTVVTETGTEVAQEAGEAALRREVGVPTIAPLDAAFEAIGPAVVMSLLFGSGVHGIDAKRRRKTRLALENPDTAVEERQKAVQDIKTGIGKKNEEFAGRWETEANDLIADNQPIPTDVNVREFVQASAAQRVQFEPTHKADGRSVMQRADLGDNVWWDGQNVGELGENVNLEATDPDAAIVDGDALDEQIATGSNRAEEKPITQPEAAAPTEAPALPFAEELPPAGEIPAEIPLVEPVEEPQIAPPAEDLPLEEPFEAPPEAPVAPETAVEAPIIEPEVAPVEERPAITTAGEAEAVEVAPEPSEAPTTAKEVDIEAQEAATSPKNKLEQPTEAQKEAGNYKKGHVNLQGLDVSIENPKGSTRSGVNKEGEPWTSKLKAHYGYIKRTEGADGDQVDVFVGEKPKSKLVYVVNQVDPDTGKFDEHKVMLGYESAEKARKGYLENYEKGWKGGESITPLTVDAFKIWLEKGDNKKPIEHEGTIISEKVIKAPKEVKTSTLVGWINSKGFLKDPKSEFQSELIQENNPSAKFVRRKKVSTQDIGYSFDQLAQMAFDEGIIKAPSVEAFKTALKDPKFQLPEVAEKKLEKELDKRDKIEKAGKITIDAFKLDEGDRVVINGETFEHKGIDDNGDVILEDGVQKRVDALDALVVDKVIPKKEFELTAKKEKAPKKKPVQQDLIGAKEGLQGPLTAAKGAETPLEKAKEEAAGRKAKAEAAKKQITLPDKGKEQDYISKEVRRNHPTLKLGKKKKALPLVEGIFKRLQNSEKPNSSGVRVLGVGISVEFMQKGFINLTGRTVGNADDLAAIAQIFRDPQVETLRFVYMKGDKIVGHEGITSKIPDDVAPFSDNPAKDIHKIRDRMKRLKADGYWVVHNHPTGDPVPSSEDRAFTKSLSGLIPGLKSHIIINSGKYSVIDTGGKYVLHNFEAEEKLLKPSLEHELLGKVAGSTSEILKHAQTLDKAENVMALFFLNPRNKINALVEVPVGMLKNEESLTNYLRARARESGSVRVIPVVMAEKITPEMAKTVMSLKEREVIVDFLAKNPETGGYFNIMEIEGIAGSRLVHSPVPDSWMGIAKKPGIRVAEDSIFKASKSVGDFLKQSQEEAKKKPSKEPSAFERLRDDWFKNKDKEALRNSVEASHIQKAISAAVGEKGFGKKSREMDRALHIYLDLKAAPQHRELVKKGTNLQKLVDLADTIDQDKDLMAIARAISESYEKVGLAAMEKDVIKNVVDNYVSRVWKQKVGKSAAETMRKFGVRTRHAKTRVFATIIEGMSEGFELAVEGASNNLNVYKDEISRTIEDRKLVDEMVKQGIATFSQRDAEGQGLVQIRHPNFKKWTWAGKAEIEGVEKEVEETSLVPVQKAFSRNLVAKDEALFENKPLYAEKEVAENLNRVLGKSKLDELKGIKTITKYNAIIKAFILQTAFFHHLAFMRSYLLGVTGKKLGEWNFVQAKNEGLKAIQALHPDIELLVANGLTLGKMQDWEESILRSEDTIFGRAMDKVGVTKKFKDWANDMRQRQADFLFRNFGAGLKAKAALIELDNVRDKHKDMPADDQAKMVANLINDDFGGLHLGRLDRNPTTQHIFRLFALAPDWTESNIRTMWKMFRGGEKAERQLYRRFWMSVISKGLTATMIANFLMALGDDEDNIERFKKAYKAGNFRWMDIDITPVYKLFGGETEARKYFSLVGHFKDPIKFIWHPFKSAHHKGSVVYRVMYEAASGRDWKQQRFTTIEELLGVDDKGIYVAGRKKGEPKGGKLRGKLTTFGAGGTIGFKEAPSYTLAQIRSAQPIFAQQMIAWLMGEIEGFDAITRSFGLHTTTTYPSKKSLSEQFANDFIEATKAGNSTKKRKIRQDINAYNKRMRADGTPEKIINLMKAVNRIKKERRLRRRQRRRAA